jgi:hypothetical protein
MDLTGRQNDGKTQKLRHIKQGPDGIRQDGLSAQIRKLLRNRAAKPFAGSPRGYYRPKSDITILHHYYYTALRDKKQSRNNNQIIKLFLHFMYT